MRRFAAFFAAADDDDPGGQPRVRVPEVYLSTRRVLVMEYVPSAPVTSSSPAQAAELCARLVGLFLEQFLELGFVHTDLHAGNLGLDARGDLVMYDFGSAMDVPPGLRECTKRLMAAYLNRDPAVMLDYMVECDVLRGSGGAPLTHGLAPDQRAALEAVIERALDYAETADVARLGQALRALPPPPAGIDFRSEVFMALRSFTLLEGLCKQLSPGFTIIEGSMPYLQRALLDPDMLRMKVEDDLRTLFRR